MTAQKATKAIIQLGETSLNVYRIDSNLLYRLSRTQIALVVDKSNFRYTELSRSKKGQILLQQGVEGTQKIYTEGVAPFESVTLEQAASFWALELSIGNQKALGLVIASTAESIERRADKAFGVELNETRRNEVFQERQAPTVTIKERVRRQKALDALYRADNPLSSLKAWDEKLSNAILFGVPSIGLPGLLQGSGIPLDTSNVKDFKDL